MNYRNRPVTIAGTGGSGTRVVTQILRKSGFFMGNRCNEAEDSGPMEQVVLRWAKPFLLGDMDEEKKADLVAFFRFHQGRHREGIPDKGMRWGWKNPRGLFLLPLYLEELSALRYIHMVRDGRDIAFSKNQGQTRDFRFLLSKDEQVWPEPLRCIRLWALANLAVTSFAQAHCPDQYHCLRYEDLCEDTEATVARLLEFVGLPTEEWNLAECCGLVEDRGTIGRHKLQSVARVEALEDVGRAGLEFYGYLSTEGGRSR